MVALNFKRTVLRLGMHEIFKSLWLLNLNLQWTQEVIVDSNVEGDMYDNSELCQKCN